MKQISLAIHIAIVILFLNGSVNAQVKTADTGRGHPWTSLKTDTSAFTFAVVGDRTSGAAPGVFESAVEKLNMLRPDFVMSVGDFIQGYSDDSVQVAAQWSEFDTIIGKLQVPFFYVPGNHDVGRPVPRAAWFKRFGKDFYGFVYKNALFLCMDSEDSTGDLITVRQLAWVKKTLAENASVRWTFVFYHHPIQWSANGSPFWSDIWPLLEKRKATIFFGHYHHYVASQDDKTKNWFVMMGTTGCLQEGHEWEDGAVNMLSMVTLSSDGMHLANMTLDAVKGIDAMTVEKETLRDSTQDKLAVIIPPISRAFSTGVPIMSAVWAKNNSPRAVHLTGTFDQNPYFGVTAKALDSILKSGDSLSKPLRIVRFATPAPGVIEPLRFSWRATATDNGRDSGYIFGTYCLWPDSMRSISRRTRRITVDGLLSDWPALPVECTRPDELLNDTAAWHGPNDCSFRFATAYDDSFLYVAINVTDDSVIADAGRAPWDQDGIEFRIDARSDPVRSSNNGSGEMSSYLLIGICPVRDSSGPNMISYITDNLPKNSRAQCVRTSKGYAAEFAIPVAWLDAMQGKPWQAVRINIALDDRDKAKEKGSQIWWKPDWRGKRSYIGSGTFTKR